MIEDTEREKRKRAVMNYSTAFKAFVSFSNNPTLALTHTWGGNWPA
jgi:hypothetical protein